MDETNKESKSSGDEPLLTAKRKLGNRSGIKSRTLPTLSLEKSLVQDNIAARVIPNVFVGSLHCAYNQEGLQENGVTHILNVSGMAATFPKEFTYLRCEMCS
jgi:hypothetical protein